MLSLFLDWSCSHIGMLCVTVLSRVMSSLAFDSQPWLQMARLFSSSVCNHSSATFSHYQQNMRAWNNSCTVIFTVNIEGKDCVSLDSWCVYREHIKKNSYNCNLYKWVQMYVYTSLSFWAVIILCIEISCLFAWTLISAILSFQATKMVGMHYLGYTLSLLVHQTQLYVNSQCEVIAVYLMSKVKEKNSDRCIILFLPLEQFAFQGMSTQGCK